MKLLKVILIFILYFLIFSGLFAEDIVMEISPNPVGRGDRFSIDFFIDYEDMSSLSVEPPILPDGISLYKGPYIRPYWLQLPDGSSRKKTIITYTYSTKKVGRFELGPFIFTLGDSLVKTDPNIIRIGLYKNRELYIPYNVEWSFTSGSVYEGQAIPLVLEVKDLEEVMLFNDVKVASPDKGFMEAVNNLGQVNVTSIGDFSLYTIPVRGFIFTPSATGKMKIPIGTVTARGISSVSETTILDILKIPEEISTTGAIGKFKTSAWLKNNNLVENENIELHIKVEGSGNLNYFQLQPPVGDGLTLVNTIEISDYLAFDGGYSGSRETVYTFISDSPGDKNLLIPAFPFFDPDDNNVNTGRITIIPFTLKAKLSNEVDNTYKENFPFLPKRVDSGGFSSTGRYKDPASYLWLLPGPLVFLIFLLMGRKKAVLGVSIIFIAAAGQMKTNSTIDLAIGQYEAGQYERAIEYYTEARNELPDNSYISFNLALAYYQIGDFGRAVFYARDAFYHDPLNADYKNLINYIEEKGEILYPVELSFNLYPDAFLFLLMILVNTASFVGVIYLVKNKNIYFISSVLLLGLSVLTIGGMSFSIIQKGRQVGIILQDSISVKKIPRLESETVVEMKSGESVLIKGESNNFLFINTGQGIKGWIEESDLIILKD